VKRPGACPCPSSPRSELAAVRILDARGGGIIFKADHVLSGNGHARAMPGPQAHWAKIAFQRYFMASRKHGVTAL
jgi:sulfide:quinone oxidoreductase